MKTRKTQSRRSLEQVVRRTFAKLNCLLGMHEWTCAAEQGIKPTAEQLEPTTRGSLEGFWEYATTYCARCGKVSKLSKR